MKNVRQNQKESERVINPNIVEDLENQRYEEVEGIVQALQDFPGSTREELWQLAPSCDECFNRSMSWLEAEGVIYRDGNYLYLSDGE